MSYENYKESLPVCGVNYGVNKVKNELPVTSFQDLHSSPTIIFQILLPALQHSGTCNRICIRR
jgi:hypothetical protein